MRFGKLVVSAAIFVAVSQAMAQNMPHGFGGNMGQHDNNGPPPPDGGPDGGGPPRGPDGGPDGGRMGGQLGGPDGVHGGPGGPMNGPRRSMGAMTSYIELVERFTKLSEDASTSGVSAVINLTEVLRPKGAQVIIDELNKLLPTVKDATVARAIRLQLIDFYRASNQPDKAIEQAEILISGSAATTQPTAQ